MSFGDFFESLPDIDWVGVLVGTIALMVLGWLWYGPLFGKQWSKATGQAMGASGMPPAPKLIGTAIYSLVFNIGLAYTSGLAAVAAAGGSDVDLAFDQALVHGGIIVGVLIVAAVLYSAVVWSSYNRSAWMIDSLFWIVAATVGLWVQGFML